MQTAWSDTFIDNLKWHAQTARSDTCTDNLKWRMHRQLEVTHVQTTWSDTYIENYACRPTYVILSSVLKMEACEGQSAEVVAPYAYSPEWWLQRELQTCLLFALRRFLSTVSYGCERTANRNSQVVGTVDPFQHATPAAEDSRRICGARSFTLQH